MGRTEARDGAPGAGTEWGSGVRRAENLVDQTGRALGPRAVAEAASSELPVVAELLEQPWLGKAGLERARQIESSQAAGRISQDEDPRAAAAASGAILERMGAYHRDLARDGIAAADFDGR